MEKPRMAVAPGGRRLNLARTASLVPAALTLASILLGFHAVLKVSHGQFLTASLLILLATLLDKLDGIVARATGTASDFGRELDSLADIVSFGVAPATLAHAWALEQLGKVGSAAAFLFVGCGALRLARFNIQTGSVDRRWFVGLPIPMASALVTTLACAHALEHPPGTGLQSRPLAWGFLAVVLVAAGLMVSRVRYLSFKDVHIGPRPLKPLLVLMAVIVALAVWPEAVLPGLAVTYALHGPLLRIAPGLRTRAAALGGAPDAGAVADVAPVVAGRAGDES
jgi:CDP-diacylglycerol--serine O-phosphatidyltransferase